MFKFLLGALAVATAVLPGLARGATFAHSVVQYNPGAGFATEFGTGQGYTNTMAALGEPSRANPGQFGGAVEPFTPPFLKEQLLSIGTGGSLTLEFDRPILNDPRNAFGLDFIVFGSTGFVITNGNFTGGGITDGTLFGANSGSSQVFVSEDNLTYYQLDPTQAPVLDRLFPTDGSGDIGLPVPPGLTEEDFAGKDLAGIRSLYAGSAGGAAFDLSWARQADGQPIELPSARFVRIEVPTGTVEIDGIAAVPEPGIWILAAWGGTFALMAVKRRRRS